MSTDKSSDFAEQPLQEAEYFARLKNVPTQSNEELDRIIAKHLQPEKNTTAETIHKERLQVIKTELANLLIGIPVEERQKPMMDAIVELATIKAEQAALALQEIDAVRRITEEAEQARLSRITDSEDHTWTKEELDRTIARGIQPEKQHDD